MHLTTFAILPSTTPHLHQSATSSFLKPILLMFPSTCSLHFILSQPCSHFHLLHVPHFLYQNVFLRSSQNMIIPPSHIICPCQLICCFFQSQHVHQLHCIPHVHQLYTAHCLHHRSFCTFQNSYFIFSKTPSFASI